MNYVWRNKFVITGSASICAVAWVFYGYFVSWLGLPLLIMTFMAGVGMLTLDAMFDGDTDQ